MRTVKAWAIVTRGATVATRHYVSVYWLKSVAKEHADSIFPDRDYGLIRVEIRELKPKAKGER